MTSDIGGVSASTAGLAGNGDRTAADPNQPQSGLEAAGGTDSTAPPAPIDTKVDDTDAVRVLEDGPGQLASVFNRELSLASRSIHADDYINTHRAVAPPMHVSTTFRYARDPDELVPWLNTDVCDRGK